MASLRTFLDTNILVYADDNDRPVRSALAQELVVSHLRQHTGVISIQVLQEYFFVVTRKYKVDSTICREKVEIFSTFSVFQPTSSDVLAAIDLHRLHHISFWDALILRAALQSGCRTLLSEDMQHGRKIDGLEIVNPFL